MVESGLCKVWLTPRHLLALATATRLAIGEEGRPMNLEFSHFPSWRTILHSIFEANELKLFIMFLVAVIMPDSWDVTRMELEGASEQPKKVEITRKVEQMNLVSLKNMHICSVFTSSQGLVYQFFKIIICPITRN